jgi:hypothetical protein
VSILQRRKRAQCWIIFSSIPVSLMMSSTSSGVKKYSGARGSMVFLKKISLSCVNLGILQRNFFSSISFYRETNFAPRRPGFTDQASETCSMEPAPFRCAARRAGQIRARELRGGHAVSCHGTAHRNREIPSSSGDLLSRSPARLFKRFLGTTAEVAQLSVCLLGVTAHSRRKCAELPRRCLEYHGGTWTCGEQLSETV